MLQRENRTRSRDVHTRRKLNRVIHALRLEPAVLTGGAEALADLLERVAERQPAPAASPAAIRAAKIELMKMIRFTGVSFREKGS